MFREIIQEAKIKDPVNQSIAEAFTKSHYVDGKLTFKESNNQFAVTLKESDPQTSNGKINETMVEKILAGIGATAKFGLRDMIGKGWGSDATVSDLGDYSFITYRASSSNKYETTVITFR